MNQQINLYQPIFRRQKKVFSAMAMIQITTLFIFAFGAIYLYGEIKMQPIKEQLVSLDSNLVVLKAELVKLQKQHAASSTSKLLENEIARLSKELTQRQQIQNILTNRIQGNTSGLSAYLEAFARQIVQGAWLTNIVINNGGNSLILEGRTLSSELVPVYIDGLAGEPLLNGTSFNVMELSRPDEPSNYFNFRVSTN
jgi:hypothetical protein